jgi:hypothetical protein
MKTQILLLSAIVILSNSSVNVSSPAPAAKTDVRKVQNVDFAFFRTHRQAWGADATWGLSSTDGVTGFELQRTYQDPTDPYSLWEDVKYIPCTPDRSFKYNDKDVLAGYIYYRVIAQLNDGSTVMSEVSGVRIVSH